MKTLDLQSIETAIDDILADFDFAAAHQAMVATKHVWATTRMQTPTIPQIKDAARKNLRYMIENPEILETNGGGFHISRDNDGEAIEFSYCITSSGPDPTKAQP